MFVSLKIKTAILVCSTTVCLTLAGRSVPANASTILSPVSATASSEFSNVQAIGATIDQSGLSQPFTSGVTDFDFYIGLNTNHLGSSTSFLYWLTPRGVTSATIFYDLGALYTIDRFALWNASFAGIGSLDVLASSDGVSYTGVASGLIPSNGVPGDDSLADIFSLGSTVARYIQLEVSGCPQPGDSFNGCGMGEIAFSVNPASPAITTPEPSALLGLGILGLGFVSWRQFGRFGRDR